MADEILAEVPAESEPEVVAEAPKPKPHMIPDDRVKKMLEKARLEALEEGKRQMQEQLQSQMQQQIGQPQGPAAPAMQPQVGGNIDDIVAQKVAAALQAQTGLLAEQQKKLREQQEAHERAGLDAEFKKRMDEEIARNPEASKDMADLDLTPYEHVKYLATLSTDNTGQVMHDLAKRRPYLASLQQLAVIDPRSAAKELQQLSASLKDRDAKVAQAASSESEDPLPRVNPSATAGVDNGRRSIRDWKKLSRTDSRFRF